MADWVMAPALLVAVQEAETMSSSLTLSSPKSKGTIWGNTAQGAEEEASRIKETEIKNQRTNQSTT